MQDIFCRFHRENFLYLNDFNTVFLDNNLDDENKLDENIKRIINNNFQEQIANRDFIKSGVDNFDINSISNFNNKLLMLLSYEEYLVRKLFLNNGTLENGDIIEEYYKSFHEFMINNGIDPKISKEGIGVKIADQNYLFDYCAR